MANENGFQKSILIPVSRYQQLLHYQSKTNVIPETEQKSVQCESAPSLHTGECVSHQSWRATSTSSDNDLGKGQNLLYTINSSFSKSFCEKMSRLLLFIMNFGSHLITFNEAGNILIHDRIMDKKIKYC